MKTKIVTISLILILGLVLFGCTSQSTTNNTQVEEKTYQLGEAISIGDLTYTVKSIDQYEALGSEYLFKEPSEDALFYVVELKIENTSNSEKSVSISNDITITDTQGRTFTPDAMLSTYAKQTGLEALAIFEKIQPGLSKTGVIVFEMPNNTTGKIIIKNGFSGEAKVEFK
jgi:hypothetical protein